MKSKRNVCASLLPIFKPKIVKAKKGNKAYKRKSKNNTQQV